MFGACLFSPDVSCFSSYFTFGRSWLLHSQQSPAKPGLMKSSKLKKTHVWPNRKPLQRSWAHSHSQIICIRARAPPQPTTNPHPRFQSRLESRLKRVSTSRDKWNKVRLQSYANKPTSAWISVNFFDLISINVSLIIHVPTPTVEHSQANFLWENYAFQLNICLCARLV